jgi:large subunit ribosomal protein L6e
MVKWYPTEDTKRVKVQHTQNPQPLRGGISPGQVLILLAGKHQGKRVVFLKQLEGGLLLVTGPYKYNGVPLKRVPQAYTIPTSQKIDVSGADLSKITDTYFKKEKVKTSKTEAAFFTPKKEKTVFPDAKKILQKEIDLGITSKISDPLVRKYLKTKFRLRNGVFPHNLKF